MCISDWSQGSAERLLVCGGQLLLLILLLLLLFTAIELSLGGSNP